MQHLRDQRRCQALTCLRYLNISTIIWRHNFGALSVPTRRASSYQVPGYLVSDNTDKCREGVKSPPHSTRYLSHTGVTRRHFYRQSALCAGLLIVVDHTPSMEPPVRARRCFYGLSIPGHGLFHKTPIKSTSEKCTHSIALQSDFKSSSFVPRK